MVDDPEKYPLLAKVEAAQPVAVVSDRHHTQWSFVGLVMLFSVAFLFVCYYLYIYSKVLFGIGLCPSGRGKLRVIGISVSDLANVEILPGDINDPYVVMGFDGETRKTSVQQGAGANAAWDDLKIGFTLTQKVIDVGRQFYVGVLDNNYAFRDHSIGQGHFKLKNYVTYITEEKQEFSVPSVNQPSLLIVDEQSRVQGQARINFELRCLHTAADTHDDDDDVT